MIVCLGDLMIDVLAQLTEPLHVGSDTPAQVGWSGGGSAANTACWLAVGGIETAFVGRVGADVPGQASLMALEGCGVRARVVVDDELPTGTCVVLIDGVDGSGERTMIPSPGANAGLTAADVDAAELESADHLHVSGYALFGPQRDAALYALRRAHELGLSVSVGAASSAPLRTVGADAFLSWARGATLFANADEAGVLIGPGSPEAAARSLAAATGGAAVVTDGARAAHWSDGTRVLSAAAPAVQVVDSTGAGDAFSAGFLAATARGEAPAAALAHGHELAALACGSTGARPSSASRSILSPST